MAERISEANYNAEHTAAQYTEILDLIVRMTEATGTHLMNFGPNIVDEELAREEHYLLPDEPFRPTLSSLTLSAPISLTGGQYNSLGMFRPRNTEGGADAEWQGTLTLSPERADDKLSPVITYELSTAGIIESVRIYTKNGRSIRHTQIGMGEADRLLQILQSTGLSEVSTQTEN